VVQNVTLTLLTGRKTYQSQLRGYSVRKMLEEKINPQDWISIFLSNPSSEKAGKITYLLSVPAGWGHPPLESL
jgi:hypothetical protein